LHLAAQMFGPYLEKQGVLILDYFIFSDSRDPFQDTEGSILLRSAAFLAGNVISFCLAPYFMAMPDILKTRPQQMREEIIIMYGVAFGGAANQEDLRRRVRKIYDDMHALQCKHGKTPAELRMLAMIRSHIAEIERRTFNGFEYVLEIHHLLPYRVFYEREVLEIYDDLTSAFQFQPEEIIADVSRYIVDPAILYYLSEGTARDGGLLDSAIMGIVPDIIAPLLDLPIPIDLNGEQLLHIREDLQPEMEGVHRVLEEFSREIRTLPVRSINLEDRIAALEAQLALWRQKIKSRIDNNPFLKLLRARDPGGLRVQVHLGLCSYRGIISALAKVAQMEHSTLIYLKNEIEREHSLTILRPFLYVIHKGEEKNAGKT